MIRIAIIAAGVAMANFTPAQAKPVPRPQVASATHARDINGFALGMHISEIRKRMPINHVFGETFSGKLRDVSYEFGFTALGRLYRIGSVQPLGRFAPDERFTQNLSAKLIQKYGRPSGNQLPGGPASWELIEQVSLQGEPRHPFRTMWLDAMLSDDESGLTLNMKMLDFRVLWADAKRLNSQPRNEAMDRTSF